MGLGRNEGVTMPDESNEGSKWANSTALIVIDVQKGFDDEEYWGHRNNPECEANVARLIAAWREQDWPIVFVRHSSTHPTSPLAPSSPGYAFKDVVTGEPDLLITKTVQMAHEERDIRCCGLWYPDEHVLRNDRTDGFGPRIRDDLRDRCDPHIRSRYLNAAGPHGSRDLAIHGADA
jgi:nicotinamidase-related amidase